ncbi:MULTISPECIES: DUF881 domain-containing protein [unclassified Nocardioides]|uniref:DUF881 domain-containing protein n=1 Tax=unclassified Nocardioides TaxID=2615069 RepID=UPI0009EC91CF|nr:MULTISPECIES: DUF881 domain-containing protein [unclassified Nocardioides]
MTPPTHEHRAKRVAWRLSTPAVFAAAGALFVVSATSSGGTDLRPGRVEDLPSLVRSESRQYEQLQDKARSLNDDVERLSARVDDDQVRRTRAGARRLEGPAGFSAVHGDGLTVTLSDGPDELRDDVDNVNDLVVHQQDIQAVVNAMWRAGARGIMIQGQRIISTTGIKCAGNSVELQGIPYPQPYVITAVGDPEAMQASIDGDYRVNVYRQYVEDDRFQLGWEVQDEQGITVPAYDGLRGLEYAQPLTS